jgi:hypothetical protein
VGGVVTVTDDLTVGVGSALPDTAPGAVPDNALGVALNALVITNVAAGTVVATADVPDFEIGNAKVETVGGSKVATVTLSDNVQIQGEPQFIVGANGEVVLAIGEPVLNANLPAAIVVGASGGVTQAGISISAPIDAGSVVGGASFAAEVVSNPSDLAGLEGFTLLAGQQPLVGISVTTDFETVGPVTMTLEINEEAYQAMLDAGQSPSIRRITDDGEEQTFTPVVEVRDGKAFFTFTSPGFSVFVLIATEPLPPTATPPTSVPPTATPPTATPPTATPPTATPPTSVPPTVAPPTSVPPTQAPSPTPVLTVTAEDVDGAAFPVWGIILIVLGVIAVFAAAGFIYLRRTGRMTPA